MRLAPLMGSLLALLSAVGCGGGGAGSTSSSVQIFLTDDMNTGFDHVWVTVDKVQLINQSGAAATVFNGSPGQVVDLRALNGEFLLLGAKGVPAGTYTGMQVFLEQALVVYPAGSTSGTPATFSSAYNFGATQSKLAFSFNAPIAIAGSANLIADFNLAQWKLTGSTVTAVVTQGSDVGLQNSALNVAGMYSGTITSLSGAAPNFHFTLTTGQGTQIAVATSSATGFYASDGSSPTPAPQQSVTVRGAFSVAGNALSATSVRIDVSAPAANRIVGLPSNIDPLGDTFDVTLGSANGFLPGTTVVHVVLAGNFSLFTNVCTPYDTEANFFAALVGSPDNLSIEGTYDPNTSTMTASLIKFIDLSGVEGGFAQIQGTVASSPGIDPNAGTFTLVAVSWSGAVVAQNSSVNVVTTGQTSYMVSGIAANEAAFFSSLKIGMGGVRVLGAYDPVTQTVTATALTIGVM